MAQQPGQTHKMIYSFPKAGLEDASVEELKKYLTGKCTNMKKDIKKVEYKTKKKEK